MLGLPQSTGLTSDNKSINFIAWKLDSSETVLLQDGAHQAVLLKDL